MDSIEVPKRAKTKQTKIKKKTRKRTEWRRVLSAIDLLWLQSLWKTKVLLISHFFFKSLIWWNSNRNNIELISCGILFWSWNDFSVLRPLKQKNHYYNSCSTERMSGLWFWIFVSFKLLVMQEFTIWPHGSVCSFHFIFEPIHPGCVYIHTGCIVSCILK
jgi:hypothetical protein